jgi:hypothetical protein
MQEDGQDLIIRETEITRKFNLGEKGNGEKSSFYHFVVKLIIGEK